MKKTYEKPEMNREDYDVEDVVTSSGLDTVSGGKEGMEIIIDALGQIIGQNP